MAELFSMEQWSLLIISAVFLALSIWKQVRREFTFAIISLTVSALFFYSFVALLDPFIHIWDERFHALVAKNLMHHPLMPTLYDQPVVSMAYDRWDRSVIWLHKQPLFLWQIALSYKIFGVNEFALRFPSVIMASLMLPMAYRVGKLLLNETVGYLAAVLMLSSFYTIQLVSGEQGMEHNDLVFLFYVTASLWAWVEYEYASSHSKWRWVVLIGLFSGAAILCKWLVGLLVFAALGVRLLMDFDRNRLLQFVFALVITVAVAIPWQLLSFQWYPAEAAYELEYNALHFTDALEGHGGELLYHWDNIPLLFGDAAFYMIIPGLLLLVLLARNRKVAISFAILPMLVYVFYSLAATKMQSYPYVSAMPVYLAVAALLGSILTGFAPERSRLFQLIFPVMICGIVYVNIRPNDVLKHHTSWYGYNEYHEELSKNRLKFLELKANLPQNSVLFNVSGRHYVEAMFYTGFPSYQMMLGENELREVELAGMIPVVLDDERVEIPEEILKDSRVRVVAQRIHSYH